MERPILRLRWAKTEEEDKLPVATKMKKLGFGTSGEKCFWCYKLQQAWIDDDNQIIWRDIQIENEIIGEKPDDVSYANLGDYLKE